jgi:hypothetical protein
MTLSRSRSLHNIELLGTEMAKPSVKQHLAAICQLFDYLVTGGIPPSNPAGLVRGRKYDWIAAAGIGEDKKGPCSEVSKKATNSQRTRDVLVKCCCCSDIEGHGAIESMVAEGSFDVA